MSEGYPNNQNYTNCQMDHAVVTSGMHVFLPILIKDGVSYCNRFQGLVLNWFIIQHTVCLSDLRCLKSKFRYKDAS